MTDFPPVTHLAVTVTDLTVSAPWYERLFGVEPALDEDSNGYHHTVFPLAGGMLFGLFYTSLLETAVAGHASL